MLPEKRMLCGMLDVIGHPEYTFIMAMKIIPCWYVLSMYVLEFCNFFNMFIKVYLMPPSNIIDRIFFLLQRKKGS